MNDTHRAAVSSPRTSRVVGSPSSSSHPPIIVEAGAATDSPPVPSARPPFRPPCRSGGVNRVDSARALAPLRCAPRGKRAFPPFLCVVAVPVSAPFALFLLCVLLLCFFL